MLVITRFFSFLVVRAANEHLQCKFLSFGAKSVYPSVNLPGMQALAEKRNKVEAEREGEDLEDCRATDFLD